MVRKLLPFVLILASACSGGSADASQESNPASGAFSVADAFQPDGTLRGIAFTGHVDREDPKVRPTLAFTTNDTEVTAVVGIGDVDEGSTVVVTWYRVAGLETREALFSHEIAVGASGLAFSQALAPNGLAPGIYDTEATMDGHVVHTPWVAREAGASGTGVTAQAASEDEAGDVPEGGKSWWNDGSGQPPQQGTSIDTCTVDITGGLDASSHANATAWWAGPCTTGTLTASVSGPPTILASSESLQGPVDSLDGGTWVCSLPGGNDTPGIVVHFEATGSASATQDYTLPDNGKLLLAMLGGKPGAGSKVDPGETIDITAMAVVPPPALGVKTLSLLDGTNLIKSVGNQSESDQPVACDFGRFSALIETTYQVPSDPPPVIELCANAVGLDGTESKDCIRYYTGEVWEGTVKSIVTGPPGSEASPCGNPIHVQGTAQLVVAEDGSVTGIYDVTGCGVSQPHAEWTGSVTDAGFLFPQLVVFTNGSLIPKVSPTHAQATLTNKQGPAVTWVTTWDLTCTSCEE